MSKALFRQCVVLGEEKPYLTAVFSVAQQVNDEEIQQWLDVCNASLPDYARVGDWIRLSEKEWQTCMTQNGRPQRDKIKDIVKNTPSFQSLLG